MSKKEVYEISCDFCGKRYPLELYPEDVAEYLNSPSRRYVQDIFHYISDEMRELILSNTCPECWQRMFGGEDDE